MFSQPLAILLLEPIFVRDPLADSLSKQIALWILVTTIMSSEANTACTAIDLCVVLFITNPSD
jgi:hypothetical protein